MWPYAGILCTGETYKNVVKTTFATGASLPDFFGLVALASGTAQADENIAARLHGCVDRQLADMQRSSRHSASYLNESFTFAR